MENQYQIELIPSDFEGNINNPSDCIGGRAFSRAITGKLIFWGGYDGFSYDEERDKETIFSSYRDGVLVDMMTDVKVGDVVVFKQI